MKELGSGFFATVQLVQEALANGKIMALKMIHDLDCDPTNEVKFFESCSDDDYKHIVRFYHHFKDEESKKHSLLMEYCEGGTLEQEIIDHVQPGQVIEEKILIDWAIQLLTGLNVVIQPLEICLFVLFLSFFFD